MTTESTADESVTIDSLADTIDAVLIIGHGTRDPAGLAEFRYFVDQVARRRSDWHVAGCFLELAEPSIATVVDRLVAGGMTRIRAMPLVLFSAGHAKRDIPGALVEAIARHPGAKIELCAPLGCHRELVELSIERCRQALAERALTDHSLAEPAAIATDETLLILVGRGSSDAEAIAEMHRLAALRRAGETGDCPDLADDASVRLAHVEVAFVAVATPTLGEVLEKAAQTDFRRVIVQPHLLFAGNVLSEIHHLVERQQLAEQARGNLGRQWIVTEALGPDQRLVTAVVDILSKVTPQPHGN